MFLLCIVSFCIASIVTISNINTEQGKKISTLLLMERRTNYFNHLANHFNQILIMNLKPHNQKMRNIDKDRDDMLLLTLSDIIGAPKTWFGIIMSI